MQSELSKTIDVADVKAQYDVQCKRVLSQREILARILKNVAEEFRGMELEEVAEGLLSGLSDTDERSVLLCQNDFVTDGDGICQCGV